MLVIKQGFQFLNSFSLSLKDKVVFPIGETNKIQRTVIIRNPIQVMNNPAFRQRFAMGLLPDKDMFCYIAITECPWVVRLVDADIASVVFIFATFPSIVVLPFLPKSATFAFKHQQFTSTASTSSCSITNSLTAIYTRPWQVKNSWSFSIFGSTTFTSGRYSENKLPTINAGMPMCILPFSLPFPLVFHNYILADLDIDCNYLLPQHNPDRVI